MKLPNELPKTLPNDNLITADDVEKLHDFYTFKTDAEKLIIKELKFDKLKIANLLMNMGFYRFDTPDGQTEYVRIQNNKIELTQEKFIVDAFEDYIKELPDRIIPISNDSGSRDYTLRPVELRSKLYNYVNFCKDILDRLRPDNDIEILHDTRDSKYLFFENFAIKITPDGIEPTSYNSIVGNIWATAVINRNFTYDQTPGDFEHFVEDICNENDERKASLMSILGYLLHDYYDYDLRAAFLTDVNMDGAGTAAGGTGKGLIGKAVGQMVNRSRNDAIYTVIPGKGLDLSKDTRYALADISTSILHLEDVDKTFNLQALFNDITDGATIRRPYQIKPIIKPVKMMISINHTIDVQRSSDRRRLIIFELANYYSDTFRPTDKYKKWFFGQDWTETDWNQFYSFMCRCVQLFLRSGLIEPEEINYQNRRLEESLPEDFVWFIGDQFSTYTNGRVEHEFVKQTLLKSFTDRYPAFDNDRFMRNFTKYVRQYCQLKTIPFCEIRSTNDLFIIYPSASNLAKAKQQKK